MLGVEAAKLPGAASTPSMSPPIVIDVESPDDM